MVMGAKIAIGAGEAAMVTDTRIFVGSERTLDDRGCHGCGDKTLAWYAVGSGVVVVFLGAGAVVGGVASGLVYLRGLVEPRGLPFIWVVI